MKYEHIQHHNSNNSRRRGLLVKLNKLTGKMERVNHTTLQTFRSGPDGQSLPHMESKEILRGARSVYTPHIGRKQDWKMQPAEEVAP